MKNSRFARALPGFIAGVALLALTPVPAGADPEGRWKINGSGGCYFELDDVGPNQCTPPTEGRWKLDGAGGCYFDVSDAGPNQCSPDAR